MTHCVNACLPPSITLQHWPNAPFSVTTTILLRSSAMSGHRGRCRQFFKGGRCTFGDRCKFSHDKESPNPSRQSSPQAPQQSSSTPNRATNAPNQACNFYWNNGNCARGFDCPFRHVQKPSETIQSTQVQPVDSTPPDFFSTEGLALNNGTIREERFSLNPSEAHNHLRPFLKDNYHFESPAKIQGFVRILASVNDSNKAWVRSASICFFFSLTNAIEIGCGECTGNSAIHRLCCTIF